MAHYFPPAIMNMFAPRPPLEFKAPLEKRKMPAYTGIAEVNEQHGRMRRRIDGLPLLPCLPPSLLADFVRPLARVSDLCVCAVCCAHEVDGGAHRPRAAHQGGGEGEDQGKKGENFRRQEKETDCKV